MRVSYPAVHALAREWRHEMRGIAGEEDSAGAPSVGDPGVKRVDHLAPDRSGVVGAIEPQQRCDILRRERAGVLFAVMEHEFKSPRAVWAGQGETGLRRVAVDFRVPGGVRGVLEIDESQRSLNVDPCNSMPRPCLT